MITDGKDMLSSLYSMVADLRNSLYDFQFLDSVQVPASVLSVGNLSVGGTGKTPVVGKILSLALERDLKTVVISRNYQARSRGIHRVDTRRVDGGFFYGDEPFLMARRFPQASVWTGPKKFLTAQQAVAQENCKLVIVDDGFQHRSLHRDFDLVLLDTTSSHEEDFRLPKGRLRESFASLQRASAVALTKVNWGSQERVSQLKSQIPRGLEVYEIEFHVAPQRPVETGARVLAVSGIAKPKVFERTLHSLSDQSFEVLENIVFADHHEYTHKDVLHILQRMRQLDGQQILTTEKDLVKLEVFPDLKEWLNPILVTPEFREEPRGLYAFLDRSLRL